MAFGRRSFVSTLTALVVVLVIAAPCEAEDLIEIPGGVEAVSRLLANVDTDPDRFAPSLNRALLRNIRGDHDWRAMEERVLLNEMLLVVDELRERFSFPLVLDPSSEQASREFAELVHILGYRSEGSAPDLVIEALDGEDRTRRHRIARAAGWNIVEIASQLNAGTVVRLELPVDRVPSAIPHDLSRAISGSRTHESNALFHLTQDQRLGLVMEGMRRLTPETAGTLDAGDLRWIYRQAAIPFFRSAASLRVVGGKLQVPGGEERSRIWAELVGADPADPGAFVRALLREGNLRYAHVWTSFSFAPAPVAGYLVDGFLDGERVDERLEPALSGLTGTRGLYFFSRARGQGPGLQYLWRVVPYATGDVRPRFDDTAEAWAYGLQDGDVPREPDEVTRAVARHATAGEAGPGWLAYLMTEKFHSGDFPGLLADRFIRTSRFFEESPDLMTPESAFLVARAAGRYPAALDPLEGLPIRSPDSLRDSILAVNRIDRKAGPLAERVTLRFQGSMELLARLSENGAAPGETIEGWLRELSGIHRAASDPRETLRAQSGWLRTVVRRLPDPGEGYPGRDPMERTWLAGVFGGTERLTFTWEGLPYEATRGEDRARLFVRYLEAHRVPPLGLVLTLPDRLARLAEIGGAGDVEAVRQPAAELLDGLGGTPRGDSDGGAGSLSSILQALTTVDSPKRMAALSRRLERVEDAPRRASDPWFAAPAYALAVASLDDVLIRQQPFLLNHSMAEHRAIHTTGSMEATDRWRPATLVRPTRLEAAPYLEGHLSAVVGVLVSMHVQAEVPGLPELAGLASRQRWWQENVVRPSWRDVDAEVLAVVERASSAGEELLARAVSEARDGGAAFDFAAARIPAYRLEASRGPDFDLVSPSERFSLGLAAVRGDAHGPAQPSLIDPETHRGLVATLQELEESGGVLRSVSAPTPSLTGSHVARLDSWPPYEAVEREVPVPPLVERELLDLRIAVMRFLARHRLPAGVGRDLQAWLLDRASSELRLETLEDWESVIRWVNGLEDPVFRKGMRWCLEQGYFRLQ